MISPKLVLVLTLPAFIISAVHGACYMDENGGYCDTGVVVTTNQDTGDMSAVMGPEDKEIVAVTPFSTCLVATKTLMDSIHSFYDDSDSTITVLEAGTTRLPTKTIIDDFSSNSAKNYAYKYRCEEMDGEYVELAYSATCRRDGNRDNDVTIVVYGQPRCYDPAECMLEDEDGTTPRTEAEVLCINGTLNLTEERGDLEEGEDWHCAGDLFDSTDSSSACEWQMKNTKDGALLAQESMQNTGAEKSEKKAWGFIPTSTMIVGITSDNSASFETACSATGGTPHMGQQDTIFTCSEGGASSTKDRPFQVSYLSTCVGSHCTPSEVSKASGKSLLRVLVGLQELDETW
eukprot:CAMPEP_0119022264 /NCGR_PEP_ID=MMETSP1176-20130426/27577_1 /TAXON_ID=265551 /ORGANISM="Synedropsis recta cf, Strain CCMP1620" /LENGTH=345 /DNA_ID=CAMNT_0006977053 /DNA_START=217 /DNA_END=1251 /DNA_ORIENTATION=+